MRLHLRFCLDVHNRNAAKAGVGIQQDGCIGLCVRMSADGDITEAGIGIRLDPILGGNLDGQFAKGAICLQMAAVCDFLTATQIYGQVSEGTFNLPVGKTGHGDESL